MGTRTNSNQHESLPEAPGAIRIMGMPIDAGGNRPGSAQGPSALRAAGIAQISPNLQDDGDLVPPQELRLATLEARNRQVVEACRIVHDRVRESVGRGEIPLVMGGDHALSAGSLSGAAAACIERHGHAPALIWIDAHADLNTPDTSPSGNAHGMSAASLLGYGVPELDQVVGDAQFDPGRCAFVGQRELDPGEQAIIDQGHSVHVPGTEFKKRDAASIMSEVLEKIAPGGAPFCLSFDIDVLDPEHAPGVDTAVPDGLSPDEIKSMMHVMSEHGGMVSMDVVEVNPPFDPDGRTSRIAVELVAAALKPRPGRTGDQPPKP